MTDTEILEELHAIVPTWKDVDLTKVGYNAQYVQTLVNLLHFIKGLEK